MCVLCENQLLLGQTEGKSERTFFSLIVYIIRTNSASSSICSRYASACTKSHSVRSHQDATYVSKRSKRTLFSAQHIAIDERLEAFETLDVETERFEEAFLRSFGRVEV